MNLVPSTSYGKISVIFGGLFVVLYLVSAILAGASQMSMGNVVSLDPAVQPYLELLEMSALISGGLAFILGIIGCCMHTERSVLSIISLGLGFFVVLFAICEILIRC
jgi:hypothetical protein